VKTHVRRVLAKLGLQSRLQAGLLMQRIVLTAS
jgi:DNA-binding CsgD family transcriptional regulator